MSGLVIKHIFGIRSSLNNSLGYLDEHCYFYPSSRHLIFYDSDYKSQRFIPYGNESEQLECLAISPNKQYLAIGLKTLERCRLILYELSTENHRDIRRRKILPMPTSIRSNHVVSLVFSSNSKYLLALCSSPDYSLVCWSMDRWKLVGASNVHLDLSHHPFHLQVSFHPTDASQIFLTGNHLCRLYSFFNGRCAPVSPNPYQRCESLKIICHCWLTADQILVGLDPNSMCTINTSGDLLQRYDLTTNDFSRSQWHSEEKILPIRSTSAILYHPHHHHRRSSSAILLTPDRRRQRRTSSQQSQYPSFAENHSICFLAFTRGVFVSTLQGDILMFERAENSGQLSYLRRLILPSSSLNFPASRRVHGSTDELISSFALSPNEETLLVGTNHNHLYEIAFSKMDYTKKETSLFTVAIDGAHRGAILNGVVSLRKPMLFTIGMDRSLKVWNLQTNHAEFDEKFPEQPLAISVHPMGIFLAISFVNALRIYLYTIDGLTLFHQFDLFNIRTMEYSHQGHFLAILSENSIYFADHADYQQTLISIRSARKAFRLLRWSDDDAFVLTIDFDELIARWDIFTGQCLSQYQVVDFTVEEMFMGKENKLAYLLCSDRKIREFQLMTTMREISIPFDEFLPSSLAFDRSARSLFIGSEKGSICTLVTDHPNTFKELHVHQNAIKKILVTLNDELVISLGEDGTILFYSFTLNDEKNQSKEIFREELLINEVVLQEKMKELNDLIESQGVMERNAEKMFEEKTNESSREFSQFDLHCQAELESIQRRLVQLEQTHLQQMNEQENQLNQLIEQKEQHVEQFNEEKKQSLEKLRGKMTTISLDPTGDPGRSDRDIQSIHLSYRKQLDRIQQRFAHLFSRSNSSIDLNWEDFEVESTELSETFERQRRILLDQIEQLENGEVLLRFRIEQIEDESTHFDQEMKICADQRHETLEHIDQIERDLHLAKETIQQRHSMLHDQIQRIEQMESRKDELEKFLFVFNYKIRELTNELHPRHYEFHSLIEQFHQMDKEFISLTQLNQISSIEISDLQAKLRSNDKQVQQDTQTIRTLNESKRQLREDLISLCQSIHQPEEQLRRRIRDLYRRCCLSLPNERRVQSRLNVFDIDRQRAFFERSSRRFQSKIVRLVQREKIDEFRRIQEQIHLMKEISITSLNLFESERNASLFEYLLQFYANDESIQEVFIEKHQENFFEEKQSEFSTILSEQEKRLELLSAMIFKLER